MNFGEKEDFFERHRYFFDDHCFKFEGLTADKQKELTNIVKKLSGDVTNSNDADFILCESSYFKKLQKNNSSNYYSIEFISDCISQNILLNINDYKFCREDKENVNDNNIKKNKISAVQELKENHRSETRNNNLETKSKNSFLKKEKVNDSFKNWRKRKSPERSIGEKEIILNAKKEKVPEVIDLSSDESDEFSVKIYVSPKCFKILDPLSTNSKFIYINRRKINENEKKNCTIQSNEKAGPSNQITNNKTAINNSIKMEKEAAKKQTSVVISRPSSSSSSSFSPPSSPSSLSTNDEVNDNDNKDDTTGLANKKEWWLESLKSLNRKVGNIDTVKGYRGPLYTILEQRLMIAFLIKYKLICASSSSKIPWELMHKIGYLRHRTKESLYSHYKKIILPNIKTFNLPKKYENKFLLVKH